MGVISLTVRQLLQDKPPEVWTIRPEETVYRALEVMAEKDVGALLVMEGEKVVGIVSERDYARRIILEGKSSMDTRVADLMTKKVYYVHPGQTVEECMAVLTEKRIRHLPVMDGDRLIGIVSIGDVLKAMIDGQNFAIRELERYITGHY